MAHIPGCFDDNDFAGKSRPKISKSKNSLNKMFTHLNFCLNLKEVPEYQSDHKQIIPSTVSNYTNANVKDDSLIELEGFKSILILIFISDSNIFNHSIPMNHQL